jgi:predicted RNA-binding protein with PUA-like domain
MAYWLMKSEPDCFSIDDLAARPMQTEAWDSVRNYQVRNMMRDDMRIGDLAFFYHSSCPQPGIYGEMEIVSNAYPDPTQFDPEHEHHDPKARREEPRWLLVEVRFRRRFDPPVLLETLRAQARRLQGLRILERGSRLSVTPVSPSHWKLIQKLGPGAG